MFLSETIRGWLAYSKLISVLSLGQFNVRFNQMTGTIPSNLQLRQLFYMDLSFNQFSGTIPPDLGTESVRLRHLYLDHNRFEGTFPSQVLNQQLKALTLNDNQFTGTFPGNHRYRWDIGMLTIHCLIHVLFIIVADSSSIPILYLYSRIDHPKQQLYLHGKRELPTGCLVWWQPGRIQIQL